MATDSKTWIGYTTAIAQLARVSPVSKTQRWHVAPGSFQTLVSAKYTNQFVANYMIYYLANSIPRDDAPLLEISGNFLQNYENYLNQVDLSSLIPPEQVTAVQHAQGALDSITKLQNQAKTTAQQAYLDDCPLDENAKSPTCGQRVDQWTGEALTASQYYKKYRPEIATYQTAFDAAVNQLNLVIKLALENPRLKQYNDFRNALTLGKDENVTHPGYNMEDAVVNNYEAVSMGQFNWKPPSGKSIERDPQISLAGNFESDLDRWIDTFPKDYASTDATYHSKAQYRITTSTESMSNGTWENWGYLSATSTTGTHGWIFWSYTDTTTHTTVTHDINISHSDFKSGLEVTAWGIGTYPIIYGKWYNDVLSIFPTLNNSAWNDRNIANKISQKYTTLVVGYGVEIKFILSQQAWNSVENARKETVQKGGSLSIFGCIYSSRGGGVSSNSTDWSNLTTNFKESSVTLRAQNNKAPVVLGALASRASNIPQPPKGNPRNFKPHGPYYRPPPPQDATWEANFRCNL